MSDLPANLQAPRASGFRGLAGVLLGGLVLLLALAYWDAFKGLWNYWIDGYNWQFLIPVAFVYMLRERRDLYAGLTRQPNVLVSRWVDGDTPRRALGRVLPVAAAALPWAAGEWWLRQHSPGPARLEFDAGHLAAVVGRRLVRTGWAEDPLRW